MTARLPCMVSRDDARRADAEGRAAAREAAISDLTDEIGNTLEAFIKRQYGVNAWSDTLATLAGEIAEHEYTVRRNEVAVEAYEMRRDV